MPKSTVAHAGCSFTQDAGGWYTVTCWYHLEEHGRVLQDQFGKLSWSEATTAAVAFLDLHRPGWAVGDGWHQPALDLEDVSPDGR